MPDIFGGPTLEDLREHWKEMDAHAMPTLATWQCPGCGRIYTVLTDSCACQMHRWVQSGTALTFDSMKVGR